MVTTRIDTHSENNFNASSESRSVSKFIYTIAKALLMALSPGQGKYGLGNVTLEEYWFVKLFI